MSNYHDYVCSYCGASASYDGRCGDGPYLTCGHESAPSAYYDGNSGGRGDTYQPGPGRPVPRSEASNRIAELEAELRRLRGR